MAVTSKRKHPGGVLPIAPVDGIIGNARAARKYALKAMEYADRANGKLAPALHRTLAATVAELDAVLEDCAQHPLLVDGGRS